VTGNQAVGYGEDADWASLEAAPTVEALLANGYRFVYMDERWWRALPEASRADLSQGCVTEAIALDDAESFRKLLDLGGCPG
jgi:hypothetical protein